MCRVFGTRETSGWQLLVEQNFAGSWFQFQY